MKFIKIFILIIFTTVTFGQSLTKEIDSIYNFKPSTLSDKEQELKIQTLDNFWEKVKNDTIQYLPLLRNELKTNVHNPYFYYDGVGLLLSLTKNKADNELAIESISKCDLNDISPQNYVMTLNNLSNEGFDVTKAAIKILDYENFSFFIPEHSMTFNQGYCLTYILLPQESLNYLDTLMSIFKTLKSSAQKSVITTLWFVSDCKSDAFLKSVMSDKTLEKGVREYSIKIMSYTKIGKEQEQYIKEIGREQLGNLRNNALKRFSDEAIDDLDLTTKVKRQENNCQY